MTDTAPAVPASSTAGQEALSSQQSPRPKALSLRKNFGWALVGNLIYQASQWLNLVILAKLLDVAEVGRFALALAICTPITTFSALNLRVLQVTDTDNQHQFSHFLTLQLIMSMLSICVIALIASFWSFESQTAWVLIVVGCGQAIVVIKDVFLAHNQKLERMDTVAISKILTGGVSIVALAIGIIVTSNLLVGVICLQAVKLAVLLLWDLRITARLMQHVSSEAAYSALRPQWHIATMLRLGWVALPLGITSVLTSLGGSIPRYFIEAYLSAEALGYFAAIAAMGNAGILVIQAASLSTLPRLSRYFVEKRQAFFQLLIKLVIMAAVLGAGGVLIAWVAGKPILSMMFRPDYAAHSTLLVWFMAYSALRYIATFFGSALNATRCFRIQVPLLLLVVGTITLAALILVPAYGLVGAIWSMIAGRIVHLVVAAAIIVWAVKSRPLQKCKSA